MRPTTVPPRRCCVPASLETSASKSALPLRTPRQRTTTSAKASSSSSSSDADPSRPRPPRPTRFVLVRHGQSTWNAEGRIQGSSDISVLTKKGRRQAREAAELLSGERFDAMAHSPLSRAAETASIVWAGNARANENKNDNNKGKSKILPVVPLYSLREIDLHSLQGLLKGEGLSGRHAAAYAAWKSNPEGFEIDGKAPVRDLWERARAEAWPELASNLVSSSDSDSSSSSPPRFLVVAHSSFNQALVSVALGLPPRAFRRIVQSNGCVTELELRAAPFSPSSSSSSSTSSPSATVLRLNVGPRPPLKPSGGGVALVVLVSLEPGGGERSGSSRSSPSLAKALFGNDEDHDDDSAGRTEDKSGFRLPADAPIVLANPSSLATAAAAVEAGFDERSVRKAAAAATTATTPSPPPPLSFWRSAALAASEAPGGYAVAIGSSEDVEEALRESLSDLLVEQGGGKNASSSSSSSLSSFFSAPVGGVSVVEVSSASVAAGVFEGTIRCANWRRRATGGGEGAKKEVERASAASAA